MKIKTVRCTYITATSKKNEAARPIKSKEEFLKDHLPCLLQGILIVNLIFFSQTSSSFSKVAISSCSKEAITKTTGTNCSKSANNQPSTSASHRWTPLVPERESFRRSDCYYRFILLFWLWEAKTIIT